MSGGLVAFLRALLAHRHASGGKIPPRNPDVDSTPVALSPGQLITDPDEAESLGFTVDARRLRRQQATQ